MTADRKVSGGGRSLSKSSSGTTTPEVTIVDRHRKPIITCKRCGYKFRAGDGPQAAKHSPAKKDAEKKVASFMSRLFLFAIVGIVAVFIFLWAIGKFG